MFARPLDLSQLEEALKARDMQRPEFLYLRNRLIAELGRVREENSLAPMGNFYGVFDPSGLRHVAFFSVGRSLVSGPGVANDADALLSICLHEEHGFRILIGPPAIVRVLVDNIASRVQIEMDRSQPFMAVEQGEELGETCEMRVAQRKDLSWLIDCSLALNLEDLKVEPELVNRRVLRKRLLARVKEGKTWLVEVDGQPACKLDIGDSGPAGALIEGVFTGKSSRGKGLATRLVATVCAQYLRELPRVGLHVGRNNEQAMRAYLSAGLREVADLRLVRLSW